MLGLKDRFTPLQIQKLEKVGITNLYDFITYLPYDLTEIKPLENIHDLPEEKITYLWNAKLVNITQKKAQKNYFILDFDGGWQLKCYLFSVSKFTYKLLEIGKEYQLLLKFHSGFWNIEKFSLKKDAINKYNFILGQAELRPYLVAKYLRIETLTGAEIVALHRRLKPIDYVLNLQGLVPKSSILKEILDLGGIHHPKSAKHYQESLSSWTTFRVFLRLCLLKYIELKRVDKPAKIGHLDVDFLRNLTHKLPFELSSSQKQTVWDILREITLS